jgi:lipid A 3-O-deacylase
MRAALPCACCLLGLLLAGAAPAGAFEPAALPPIGPGGGVAGPYAFALTLENDALPPFSTDRDYTSGLELDVRFLGGPEPRGAPGAAQAEPARAYYGFVLGQAIYTPRDLGATDVVRNDRPYAGWAYLGFYWGRQGAAGSWRQHRIELGTVGPQAGGRSVQSGLHAQLAHSPEPKGWAFQIGHEVGLQYAYEAVPQRVPLARRGAGAAPFVDGGAFYRLRVGNIFTAGTAGLVLRLGELGDVAPDAAAAAGTPAPPGSVESGEAATLFATAALTAVLYDATLQGGWVHERILRRPNSPHVEDTRPLRVDLSLGAAYRWGRHTLVYALNTTSTEPAARRLRLADHGYGTLRWVWRFQ